MRQKGQTLVEFAFVVPILIFLFLSIMYLGIMFMEYLQYSNAARDAARDIATQYNESGSSQFAKSAHQLRTALVTDITKDDKDLLKRYAVPLTKLYTADWTAEMQDKNGVKTTKEAEVVDVYVSVSLTREDLPAPLEALHILPKTLKPIVYKMRIEKPTVVVNDIQN